MKKILKWGLLIFIGLSVIGAISDSGDKGSTQQPSPSASTSSEKTENKPEEKKAEVVEYGLNQAVQDKDLVFTVTAVNKKKTLGNQYYSKTAQGIYYVLTLKIENKGKETHTFDSSMAKLGDAEGREYDRSIDGQSALGLSQGNVDLFMQQIQPGLAYTGQLVFDGPESITEPFLTVRGGYFSSGAKIKLQ